MLAVVEAALAALCTGGTHGSPGALVDRRTRQGTPFDFVLALVLGDIVDDALWSEVPMAQFVVAAASLVLMKLAVSLQMGRPLAGGRAAVVKREGRAP